MRILTRYIIRELIGPSFLGFLFYTFIILMQTLFGFAEMIIKRSLPGSTVGRLLLLSLPNIIVLTIPMSLLFGILIAVGRLSSDSEIIAMRSVGISTSVIYRPVFIASFLVFLLNFYLMNNVLPGGNAALMALKAEIFTSSVAKEIHPRVFYDEYENHVIYINDVDARTGQWRGVFVSDVSEADKQKIIIASSGELIRTGHQLWLELRNATTHTVNPRKPERYELSTNAVQRILLPDKFSEQADTTVSQSRSYRSMSLGELIQEARHPITPLDARMSSIEIHKKFAIPFACLAFGIVGLPLGITNRRGGKSSGFSLSLGIILFYYVMLKNGEDLARDGSISPILAMWAPNLLLVAFGMYLIRRSNSERGTSGRTGFFSRLMRRMASLNFIPRRKAVDERRSILNRLDIPFPNIMDRYILGQFARILAMVVISTAVLWLVVDYNEVASEVAENHIAFPVVLSYYRYFILQVLNWTLPISVLLGTLITFAVMAKNNEVTALKANGVSLYRVTLPIIAMAVVISFLSYLMLDFVLPYSNQRVDQLRSEIRGKKTARSFTVQQKQWLFGRGRYLFNFLPQGEEAKVLSQVQVFEFSPSRFEITRRVFADEARWDGVGWVFVDGWMRSFSDDGTMSFSPIVHPVRLQYPERPSYFNGDVKSPTQMTYGELHRYIRKLKRSGYASDELTVELYKKTSWPFISLVMALIALPFSFKIGKRGALYGVGIALFLGFLYWTLFGVFTKFGEIGNLPAVLSAWSANILFTIAALYLFLRVET